MKYGEKKISNIPDYTGIEIAYRIREFGGILMIPEEVLLHSTNIQIEKRFDADMRAWIYRMLCFIYSRELKIISFPENWKEAIKERFMPDWVLQKWPVKYKIFRLEAMIPQYAIEKPREIFGFFEDLQEMKEAK